MPRRSGVSHNLEGFTIVELMAVMAIIGLLTSIAIPRFQLFAAKARQTEAKVQLSGIAVTEQSFSVENSSYTYCLEQAGYEPEANSIRYYETGFWNSSSYGCGNGYQSCWTYHFPGSNCAFDLTGPGCCSIVAVPWGGQYRTDGTFMMNVWANPSLSFGAPYDFSTYPTANTFSASAFGSIDPSNSGWDIWTIDQNNALVNIQSGL